MSLGLLLQFLSRCADSSTDDTNYQKILEKREKKRLVGNSLKPRKQRKPRRTMKKEKTHEKFLHLFIIERGECKVTIFVGFSGW